MTSDLFLVWLKHFCSVVKCTKEDPSSYFAWTREPQKLQSNLFCKGKRCDTPLSPPHCTPRLQPLDVSFFGPLDTFYSQEISKWLKTHPGRIVNLYQISELFNAAYITAATVQNAVSGYAATGIQPLNPDIFPDHLYSPSATTDQPLANAVDALTTGDALTDSAGASSQTVVATMDYHDALDDVSPLPHAEVQTTKSSRRSEGSTVMTSTPNMEERKDKAANQKQRSKSKKNGKN
ncbi:hypothetical protein MML48_4g00009712 [Holotrichia oblita]|uniref:Uncharacterized protein n=1 Tax=Holotrichia oblita TaxID=644536 RepID=A0ACB9T9Q3_HOLOL|nr:hypothetical protein MML48_4g00009712 [Holotrichia oblita]